MPVIISTGDKVLFGLSMDDYLSLARTIVDMFKFLYKTYFLRFVFNQFTTLEKKSLYLITSLIFYANKG